VTIGIRRWVLTFGSTQSIIQNMDEVKRLCIEIEERIARLREISAKRVSEKPREVPHLENVLKNIQLKFQLEEYMAKHSLSKLGLAKKIEVSHNQVYRWLSGKHQPGKLTLKMLKDRGIIDPK